jgi:hypothetical protein
MCHYIIGKTHFRNELRYHNKRFARVRRNKRAYNKIISKCEFFERHAATFDTIVLFDREKKTFKSRKVKVEDFEDGEKRQEIFLSIPVDFFPHRTSAEQA